MNNFLLDDPDFNFVRYDTYAELRKTEPVYWYEPMQTWLVMGYTDIINLLRSPLLSTDYLIKDKLNNMSKNDPNVSEITNTIKQWMIYNEPPTHTRLRKFMNATFDRSYIDAVMPKISKIVTDKIKTINLQNSIDFIESFAHPIPAAILAEMIGLNEIDLNTFIQWSDSIANFMQDFVVSPLPDLQIASTTAVDLIAMKEALRNSIKTRKITPKADLLSGLVKNLSSSEYPITEDELVLQLIHLIFGGHKIPQFVMSNLLHCLLERPELCHKVINNLQENLQGAINESLRFESPIQFITRHANEDFDLSGKKIKKGDSIYLMLGSGNRDENIFEKPDTFDITRKGNKHLSFGSGIHVCIGAALVRDELNAIFSQIFTGVKSIEPLYDLNKPSWTDNATFHGILTQPIKLNYHDTSFNAINIAKKNSMNIEDCPYHSQVTD